MPRLETRIPSPEGRSVLLRSQIAPRPALGSQTRLASATFDSALLRAAAGFASGVETIKASPSHATLCFMEFLHRGALFYFIIFFNSQKTGKFTKKFFNCLK